MQIKEMHPWQVALAILAVALASDPHVTNETRKAARKLAEAFDPDDGTDGARPDVCD